ncbi:EthD family reductase [Natrialbaceae archaeon A-gly3]
MITMVELLVSKDEYSHEEFVERWQGEHAEIAKELPGLEGYSTSVPLDPEDVEYDGVLRLTFESVEAMNEAWASDVGKEVMDDAAEFVEVGAGPRMVVEETVHLEE